MEDDTEYLALALMKVFSRLLSGLRAKGVIDQAEIDQLFDLAITDSAKLPPGTKGQVADIIAFMKELQAIEGE
jgi:hypothetical protein